MGLLGNILILVVSIAFLVKASDFFVDSAEKAGRTLGMPPFIIGALIVAIGTSLPEVVSSVVAVAENASEIVAGNVVGSNITNILLALGVAGLFGRHWDPKTDLFVNGLRIEKDLYAKDIPLFFATALLLYVMLSDGLYSRGEMWFSLFLLIVYIGYLIVPSKQSDSEKAAALKERENYTSEELAHFKDGIILVAAPIIIYFSAKFTVDSVIAIATIMDIGKEIIALSAVALGTSLPEVMVSISAARKGNTDMVLGNIVGSNIFNSFAAMAIPALFALRHPAETFSLLHIPESIQTFALPMTLGATLLFILIVHDKKISRIEATILLLFYVYFNGHLYGFI